MRGCGNQAMAASRVRACQIQQTPTSVGQVRMNMAKEQEPHAWGRRGRANGRGQCRVDAAIVETLQDVVTIILTTNSAIIDCVDGWQVPEVEQGRGGKQREGPLWLLPSAPALIFFAHLTEPHSLRTTNSLLSCNSRLLPPFFNQRQLCSLVDYCFTAHCSLLPTC